MKKLITTFFLIIIPLSASAAPSDQEQQEIIRNQNTVIQRDQQMEREKIKEKDIKEVEKDVKEKEEKEELDELDSENGKVVQNLRSIQCFRIKKINFSANKLISDPEEKALVENYLGKCLSLKQISELTQEINNSLVEKGYVTSRAEVPPQNLMHGTLTINIVESYLEGIIFNEEKFFDKTQKFMAFGQFEKDQILNLKPIEQGLEQVNRLRSNNATIKILPGTKEQTSVIAIENHPEKRLHLNASFDNYGNKLTGENRETVGLSQDNLFWLDDNLTISKSGNDLSPSRKKDGGTNSESINFSLPFKLYNLSFSYSKSSYFFWSGDTTRFKSTGDTSTKSVALDRLLLKNQKMKVVSNFSFTNRYNQNFIDDVKIQTSSRKASFVSAGLSNTFFFHNASLFLKPTYSKSLKILDAKQDNSAMPSQAAHAEFDIFKFYGNYTKKFQIFEKSITYNGSFDSQLSKQKLYGIDQFSIGGVYSVRGFKNGTISGESGYNFRNELSLSLGEFLSRLNNFSLTPFYDYGYIRAKGGVNSGRLSGGGLKLAYNHKNFNSSLIFSRAISKSHLLSSQNYRDDDAIFFTIASDFGI